MVSIKARLTNPNRSVDSYMYISTDKPVTKMTIFIRILNTDINNNVCMYI